MYSRISSSEPARPSREQRHRGHDLPGRAVAALKARRSGRNAACIGCRSPVRRQPFDRRRPSRPSHCAASVRHDTTRLPSSSTVHAPHAPWSQPFFVPVSPSWSRSASSSVTRASSSTSRGAPLTRRETASVGGWRAGVTGHGGETLERGVSLLCNIPLWCRPRNSGARAPVRCVVTPRLPMFGRPDSCNFRVPPATTFCQCQPSINPLIQTPSPGGGSLRGREAALQQNCQ